MADNKSATISVRFSGKSLTIFKQIQCLSEQTGMSCNEIIRYLTTIGYEAYQRGAIASFDGKVILPPDDGAVIAKTSSPVVVESTNSPVQERKRSTFLD